MDTETLAQQGARTALLFQTFDDEIAELPATVSQAEALSEDDRYVMSIEWWDLLAGGLPELRAGTARNADSERYRLLIERLKDLLPILQASGVPVTLKHLNEWSLVARHRRA